MPPHTLTNFEIQKCYLNKPKFNGFYSRNNLPNTKERVYIINIDEYKSMRTHWIALCLNGDNVTHLDSFRVENFLKQFKIFIRNKNTAINIYRIQANDSIMFGYLSVGFIDFMFKGKSLLNYTNLLSPQENEKSDKTVLKYLE